MGNVGAGADSAHARGEGFDESESSGLTSGESGIQEKAHAARPWMPASAAMTVSVLHDRNPLETNPSQGQYSSSCPIRAQFARINPAVPMAPGISDRLWVGMDSPTRMMEAEDAAPKKRGPHKEAAEEFRL